MFCNKLLSSFPLHFSAKLLGLSEFWLGRISKKFSKISYKWLEIIQVQKIYVNNLHL